MLHPLEKIAKRHFGVTDSLEETGYVLSDGTFLDLTGRHMAEGYERKGDRFVPKKRHPDYLAFQRSIDHRQLPPEIFEAAGTGEGSAAMYFFLRETGALRLMPGAGFLVARMPTVEAVARVIREWHHAFGNATFGVDVINKDGDVRESQEFEQPNLEEVMEFLENWFGRASMGGRGKRPPPPRRLPTRVIEMVEFAEKNGFDLSVKRKNVSPVDIQLDEWVDPEHVKEIVKAIREADGEWPYEVPLPVVVSGGGRLMILDGTHRTAAALYEDMQKMPVLVVDAEAFYGIQDEFDLSRFEYVHDILPHLDQLAYENNQKDKGADRERDRTLPVHAIAPGSLGAAHTGRPGRMPSSLKAFGRELRKLINSPEVFELLEEGDWGAGGCWILAQTLVEFLGPPAELYALVSDGENVQHALVKYVDMYIDYNGAQTESEFWKNQAAESYEGARLEPFTPQRQADASAMGIPCDPRARKELLKHLVRRFG